MADTTNIIYLVGGQGSGKTELVSLMENAVEISLSEIGRRLSRVETIEAILAKHEDRKVVVFTSQLYLSALNANLKMVSKENDLHFTPLLI